MFHCTIPTYRVNILGFSRLNIVCTQLAFEYQLSSRSPIWLSLSLAITGVLNLILPRFCTYGEMNTSIEFIYSIRKNGTLTKTYV